MKNIIGKKFFRLTVLSMNGFYISPKGHRDRLFLCLCDCGNKTILRKGCFLRTLGATKSCGCLKKELSQPYGYYFKYPKLNGVYSAAKQRCNNPHDKGYKNYGGRGIKFLFTGGFVKFADFCLANGWKPGLTIDRINNDGNYEPGNVRFVTMKVNNQNKRKRYSKTPHPLPLIC